MSAPEGLRSVFTPGTTRWAVRRAQWSALGIPPQHLDLPKVAVVNSSSALSSCYAHLDEISAVVQAAVREAGGLPFEIRTIAPSDFITSAGHSGRYLLPSRDLLVNDVEVMVEGAQLDAIVFLSSCDKTTPAHLMAAARLDLPAIVVPCGYQPAGRCGGREVDIGDLYEAVGGHATGRIDLPELTRLCDGAIGGPGVCAGLATANTMHLVAEALGMALPGSAPIAAASPRLRALASAAGARIVRMAEEGPSARQVLTAGAVRNAVKVVQAVGGSVNAVRHLAAIATEAELDLAVVGAFADAAGEVPLLCGVRPNGPARVEELEADGGARGVLMRLRPLLDADALSVAGATLGELLDAAPEPAGAVLGTLERPYAPEPGLLILRGSLAPEGAIAKASAFPPDRRRFEGPARVFGDEAAAMAALAAGEIAAGDVVVLRGLGARGGPGTAFAAGFVAALNGAGLADAIAVVTDGELSGLNRGITIGQVMPEAAEGGPLAAVDDGDAIEIDLDARRLDLRVAPDEIARRLASRPLPRPAIDRGWLGLYARTVGPMARGAVVGARGR